jgi:predicted small secreted protein
MTFWGFILLFVFAVSAYAEEFELEIGKPVTGSVTDEGQTYVLQLKQPELVSIYFSGQLTNIQLRIEKADGRKIMNRYISYETPAQTLEWSEIVNFEAGTYYIHVMKASSVGEYQLSVSRVAKDLEPGAYYYESVLQLVSEGIMKGFSDGTFRPNQTLTRDQAILLLKRALNLEVPADYQKIAQQFSDIGKNHEHAKEVAAVYQAGIFTGKNGKMGIYDELTREQMASVMVRAYSLKDDPSGHGLAGVTDAGLISPVHVKDVEIFYESGLTEGFGDSTFNPKGNVTRGQFAVFLDRAEKRK